MKILLTSDWYMPAVNGVVVSVQNLRRGLEARGHEVRILTLSQTARSHSEAGVTYIGSLNAGAVYPGARLRFSFGGKWVKDLLDWGPDIVHSNCEFSTFWLACGIARRLDIPLVHTYHTVYENYTHYISPGKIWEKKAVCGLSRLTAGHTDCLAAPTEKVRRLLRGYGISVPIYVNPTGIELEKYRCPDREMTGKQMREKLKIPGKHMVLLFVGRLAKEKNCEELLRVMAQFRGREVTLLLVGDGPYRGILEKQACALGLGRQVVFAGMVPPEQTGAYYQAGDVFVSASASETQGLTYLEALASGLPLLCRRDAYLQGVLIDGFNGWSYCSEQDFAGRLNRFIDSPDMRILYQKHAVRTAARFSAADFAERTEKIYRETIRRRKLPCRRCPVRQYQWIYLQLCRNMHRIRCRLCPCKALRTSPYFKNFRRKTAEKI